MINRSRSMEVSGLLDAGKLESERLDLRINGTTQISSPDMADLAAAYACGICQAHAFADETNVLVQSRPIHFCF